MLPQVCYKKTSSLGGKAAILDGGVVSKTAAMLDGGVGSKKVVVRVSGMSCSSCVAKIERHLGKMDGEV